MSTVVDNWRITDDDAVPEEGPSHTNTLPVAGSTATNDGPESVENSQESSGSGLDDVREPAKVATWPDSSETIRRAG
jgi:hypothetical protein